MDQLYGMIDLNTLVETSGDTFSAEQITANTIEPDIVIDEDLFTQEGQLNIENVLCWDIGEWLSNCTAAPDITGGESVRQNIRAGITVDNTVNVSNGPTSDVLAQHTIPGGAEATTQTRFVRRWSHLEFSNEENAAGEININSFRADIVDAPARQLVQSETKSHGWFDMGQVLTGAHYHHWVDSLLTGAAVRCSLGAYARRVEIDFLELQFDRQTLLGILQAVNQVF